MKEFRRKSIGTVSMRLMHKIFLSNILIALISMALYGAYVYGSSIDSSKKQLFENARKDMNEVAGEIYESIRRIEVRAGSLMMDDSFLSAVTVSGKQGSGLYDSYLKLEKLCTALENVDELYHISIVFSKRAAMMNNRERYFYDDFGFTQAMEGRTRHWFGSEAALKGRLVYSVKLPVSEGKPAWLVFGIQDRIAREWESRLAFYDGKIAFIGTQEDWTRGNTGENGYAKIMERIQTEGRAEGDFVIALKDQDYYALYERIGTGPLYAVSAFPAVTMERRATLAVRNMLYMLIPILTLVLLVSYIMAGHITRKLHFLYNALDGIKWLAVRMNVPQISYIVKNLSDFLRVGLNMGRQYTTLEKELKHIMSYVHIQKFRFENRIQLCVDIPQVLMGVRVNTLTLQPLVENALIHGILAEEGRTGNITVSAEQMDELVLIYVTDDGIGMSQEAADALNRRIKSAAVWDGQSEEGRREHGFGLWNVNQRLQYAFGREYGLDVISQEGEGTTCIITLPGV